MDPHLILGVVAFLKQTKMVSDFQETTIQLNKPKQHNTYRSRARWRRSSARRCTSSSSVELEEVDEVVEVEVDMDAVEAVAAVLSDEEVKLHAPEVRLGPCAV